MKKFILLFLIFLIFVITIVFVAYACAVRAGLTGRTGEYIEVPCHCGGHVLPIYAAAVYDVDYTERYADTLNAMFDHEWTVLSVEEIYEEIDRERLEQWLCHLMYSIRVSANRFLEWTIEYQDGNGDVRHFVLTNRRDFAYQVEQHVTDLILDYYTAHFTDVYLPGVPLGTTTGRIHGNITRVSRSFGHVGSCTCGGPCVGYYEAYREWRPALEAYRDLLDTPEGAIRLGRLTPANAFELVPFGIYLSFRGDLGPAQLRAFEDMLESMSAFTNHRLNASVRIGDDSWFYIAGERIFRDLDSQLSIFDYYVFKSYRGVFW